MMHRIIFILISLPALLFGQSKTPADYVNPFIGTSYGASKYSGGKTFPGAATPFGMVQVSPNTITGGDNGSGFVYEHPYIEGFAFTQMSGIGWFGDLGNLLTTPTNGPLQITAGRHPELGKGYRSKYDKHSEVAKAGYYSVKLTDYNVLAEATAAPHSGMLRFTFPENKQSRIQIDLARRVGGTSTLQSVEVIDDHTICGWMKCTPDGGGWGNGDGHADYIVFFYVQFSKPLKHVGIWSASIPDGISRDDRDAMSLPYDSLIAGSQILRGCKAKEGKHLGFYTEFATHEKEAVLMKAGISFSSMEGAKENLTKEIPAWNFDKVKADARDLWNQQLSKITVKGGTEDQKISFYTALYRTMIDPRSITDLNGDYPGADHQVHKAKGFTKVTVFSGWDVFRSQFPLQAIINSKAVSNMITSLVEMADQSGRHYFERWEFMNAYSGAMIGNPAIPVITDAWVKGIHNFDLPKAYQYAVNSSERSGNGDRGFAVYSDPPEGATAYMHRPLSISNTLEFSYSEWCLSRLSHTLGKTDDEAKYLKRSQSYRNIFDKETAWFRPRNEDGSWEPVAEGGRLSQFYGTVESNPYQQGWFVPHDIEGMAELMGGKEKAIADLNQLFEKTPKDFTENDYYNHSNEPVHLAPFLFNRLGAPWLTQKWVRFITENAYHNTPAGVAGNEDAGQMSAWFVLAASGLHQACPGDTRYEIFSPLFDKVSIRSGATGKVFTITAKNNLPFNCYIQSATLNGRPYNKCHIDHADLLRGGRLELVMGPNPDKNWGTE